MLQIGAVPMSLAMSSIVPLTILAFTYLVGGGCRACICAWQKRCSCRGLLRCNRSPAASHELMSSPPHAAPCPPALLPSQEPAALSAGFWGGAGLLMAGLALYNWQTWSQLLAAGAG